MTDTKSEIEKEIERIVNKWTGGYLPSTAEKFKKDINEFLISQIKETAEEVETFKKRVIEVMLRRKTWSKVEIINVMNNVWKNLLEENQEENKKEMGQ